VKNHMSIKLVSLSTIALLTGIFTAGIVKAQNSPKKMSVPRDIEAELVSIAEVSLRVEYDVQAPIQI
jgi:hypothetical protein